MAILSEKVRSGLVEVRTTKGTFYARPSLAQRIRLLWMFRNFRSLPRQVLNPRQQRLIDKLCLGTTEPRRLPGTCLIGAVENVPVAASFTPAQAIESPTRERAGGEIEASAVTSARRSRRAGKQQIAPEVQWRNNENEGVLAPAPIPARQDDKATPDHPSAFPGRARRRVAWTFAVGMTMGLAAVLVRSEFRRSPGAVATAVVEAQLPLTPEISAMPVSQAEILASQPDRVEQPPRLTTTAAPATMPVVLPTPTPANPPQPEKKLAADNGAESQLATAGAAAPDRIPIAAAPESFSYPVAPNPNLTGQVRLKVIIGADGGVQDVIIVSGNRVLAGAAAKAVRHWRYRSPAAQGAPGEGEANIVISFIGEDAVSVNFAAAP